MKKKAPSSGYRRQFALPGIIAALLATIGGVTLTLQSVDISGLVASATSSLTRSPVTLYLTPYDNLTLHVGEVKKIDVAVNARIPINAVGVTIRFPDDSLEVLGFTKEKSFLDLWTEETAINEDAGEIHFSGGTTRVGGLMGTGTVLTFSVRAKKSGVSEIFFNEAQVYPNDGSGESINSDMRSLSFFVSEPVRTAPPVLIAQTNSQIISVPDKPRPPNPDVNEDGKINLFDVSIMFTRLVMPYDPRFDLNIDGMINMSDVSVVLSKVR